MTDFRLAADAYLAECFARETPPHVNELADRFAMTPVQLSRAFVAENSIALAAYLKAARVARAKELLRNTALAIDAVARAAAFGTRTTFFRAFRQATGMSPETWRRQLFDENVTGRV
jgi:transcriptional regulator GlxA family with amidase domain